MKKNYIAEAVKNIGSFLFGLFVLGIGGGLCFYGKLLEPEIDVLGAIGYGFLCIMGFLGAFGELHDFLDNITSAIAEKQKNK